MLDTDTTHRGAACRRCRVPAPVDLLAGVALLFLLAVLVLAGRPACAQTGPAPISAALPAWPVITQRDMDAATARVKLPAGLLNAPPGATPKIANLPVPASPLDLQAVARGFADDGAARAAQQFAASRTLLVFVSFSIPQASLARLVDQAESSGAVLVLRGLDGGSLKATVARVAALIGKRKVAFQIDPQAFERYAIVRVPSFVLSDGVDAAKPCADRACATSASYVVVSGDVTIDFALEQFERQSPPYASRARALLRKMKG